MGQRHLEAGFAVLLAAAVMFPGLAGAQTAPLTRLYAPKPPQGSAYVRVVNPTAAAAAVSLAGGAPVTLGPATERALAYQVAPGGKPVTLTVDGKPVAGEIVPVADGFLTIALSGGPGGWSAKPLPDATEGRDDLKVMLRFYNLAEGCTAALAVADGPTVFDGVPQSESRQRAINPVDANLVGRCGPLASAPVRLPKLKAGDHYSLFLGGSATAPILQGQVDETEPYRGTAN